MVKELLSEIVNRLRKSGVKKAILFGSYARGEMDKYSDIDLVIVQDTNERYVKRIVEFQSFCDLPVQVDIFVYTPSEFDYMIKIKNPFIERVLKEGRVIYEEQF